MIERLSCCSCLVLEAEPAPGSLNVRPALATVRVSGPSIKRGGVRDPDGRERPPINPATPASTTSSYPDRGTQDLRPIRRDPRKGHAGRRLSHQLAFVVMGPGLRRGDNFHRPLKFA